MELNKYLVMQLYMLLHGLQ